MGTKTTLTADEVLAADLADWRQLLDALHARFRTGDFAVGLEFVAAVGAAAERHDHHPDVDLRYGHVDVRLTSHDSGGITSRDVELAREISVIAGTIGPEPTPDAVQTIELALDTADAAAIRPFWAAVLGRDPEEGRGDELIDVGGVLANLWFQETSEHETPRQRFHVDVIVPHDQAEARVATAIAAGGTLVDDGAARSFWVLADADGNRACVCTQLDRD